MIFSDLKMSNFQQQIDFLNFQKFESFNYNLKFTFDARKKIDE